MVFLKPEFLYGLLALAIPIIIHLFHFRKAKQLAYSNVALLQHVRKQTGRRRVLKHLLVLLCRLCAIAFLVIAFAQPFLPANDQRIVANKVDIYLDNSYSMSATDTDGLGLLDKSISLIERLLTSLPAETQYRLLTNDFLAEGQYYTGPEGLRNRLASVKYSGIVRSPEDVIHRLNAVERPENAKHLKRYWISDMQAVVPDEFRESLRKDSTIDYTIFPLVYGQTENVYVDSVFLSEPVLSADGRVNLLVRFVNSSDEEISNLPVQLIINGRQVGVRNLDLAADAAQTVSFALPATLNDRNAAEITFEDFPISFDNSFYFVLRKAAAVQIVHIYGEQSSEQLPNVFSNQALFNLLSFSQANVAYGRLEEADLLVLEGVRNPDASLLGAIQSYAASGKRVFFVPASANNGWWNSVLGALQVVEQAGAASLRILPPDEANPFYAQVFEEKVQASGMPAAKPLLQWQGSYQKILQLSNNQPYFSQSNNQFLLASPLSSAYSDFARHAIFVPSMYKLAFGSLSSEAPLYIETGTSSLRILDDSLDARKVYRLQQANFQLIPAQRVSGRQLLLDIPAYSLTPGVYALTEEDTSVQINQLAVNFPARESKLSQYPLTDWQNLGEEQPNMEVLEAGSVLKLASASLNRNFRGEALWKWAVLVVLLSLLAEILIIRFWK